MMRRVPLTQPNYLVRRERDRAALARLALLLFCGLVLVGGFVFAAGQHFAAVHYGYESEKLREERARLLAEQRRLLLEREEANSPVRLEAAAREMGLQPVAPAQDNREKKRDEPLPPPAAVMIGPAASLNR